MQPLRGVRVLDLSRLLPGPFSTLVLADLGATVDKVEDPGPGDYLRHMPPQIGGTNAAFSLLNRGKRSLVLDLKAPDARAALLAMIGSYDVLFEQFRPGVLDRLGLSIASLRTAHPKLIVCSLTGYGQTGPLAAKAGHDLNYLARSGVLGATGPAGLPPAVPGSQLADISGGLWCVIAILGALRERDRTGEGAHLDIAMSEGTLPFVTMSVAAALAGTPRERGSEELTGGIAPYGIYATQDGRFVTLAALEPKFWVAFSNEVGLEPSMGDLVPGAHQTELKRRVAEIFEGKTLAEWIEWSKGRDLLVEPVLLPSELENDEHLAARKVFFRMSTERGEIPQVRTPVTPRDLEPTAPPWPGQHTREVLEQAGLDPQQIEALLSSGGAR